jgi:hypothetical protein
LPGRIQEFYMWIYPVGPALFIEKFTIYKKDSIVTYTVTSEGKFDNSGLAEGTVSCEKKYEE